MVMALADAGVRPEEGAYISVYRHVYTLQR